MFFPRLRLIGITAAEGGLPRGVAAQPSMDLTAREKLGVRCLLVSL